MAPLSSRLALLDAAIGYALGSAALITPRLLRCPTPCVDWDLDTLLDHLGDAIGVLHEALTTGSVGARAALPSAYPGPWPGPVTRLRGQATGLLTACASAGPAGHPVIIGDRALTARLAALAGALEITVHGWDIAVACGERRPVPPVLATILLPLAPLLITPATRPGLFAAPVPLPGPACPSDRLVAFLGRQPRSPAARGGAHV